MNFEAINENKLSDDIIDYCFSSFKFIKIVFYQPIEYFVNFKHVKLYSYDMHSKSRNACFIH